MNNIIPTREKTHTFMVINLHKIALYACYATDQCFVTLYTQQQQEDDQDDEEEPQRKVGRVITDGQSSLDDTGIDVRSVPNSNISRSFVTD